MTPERSSAFSLQWSTALVGSGFTQISNLFLDSYSTMTPPLSHSEAMFVVHLMRFKWASEAPFPSYSKLSEQMGVSEASIKRYARSLEKKHYLIRRKRVGASNLFMLDGLIAKLNTMVPGYQPADPQPPWRRNP